jgi:Rps23 Pro-64 3,4-dihydroxylase Tpa1-like proline 4-hydroxylase
VRRLSGFVAASALRLVSTAMSECVWACFRRGSTGYETHLDACYDRPHAHARRAVSAILYANEGWRAEQHGGCLALWDACERCWRTVAPAADTLVLFRSDTVWHRVEAVSADAPTGRFALTRFLFGHHHHRTVSEAAL